MRAEIIAIGDELTSGQRLDTNSQWLSLQLADLGVQSVFHTTIGDSLDDNVDAFRTAARRVDVVISSGGLGPTADDLTREAMAKAFSKALEIRQEAMTHIEGLFAMRRRPMPERNRVQAMFPLDSIIIPNPHGTAPGIDLTVEGPCRFFALPGVPAEMKQMWNETVLHRLVQEMGVGKQRWFYRSLKVFGIGESDVEVLLPNLIQRDRVPRVGITVSKATITLRIACLANDEQEAIAATYSTEQEIHSALGDLVFGQGEVELHDVIHARLVHRKQTLGVIELGGDSVIATWLAAHISANSQSSLYGLHESRWYPTLDAAAKSLVPDETAEFTADEWQSQELIYRKTALSAKNSMKTDWVLIIGPYPSHTDVQDSKRMPTCDFVITLAGPDSQVRCEKFVLGGHPEILFARLAKAGLDYFRRHT